MKQELEEINPASAVGNRCWYWSQCPNPLLVRNPGEIPNSQPASAYISQPVIVLSILAILASFSNGFFRERGNYKVKFREVRGGRREIYTPSGGTKRQNILGPKCYFLSPKNREREVHTPTVNRPVRILCDRRTAESFSTCFYYF